MSLSLLVIFTVLRYVTVFRTDKVEGLVYKAVSEALTAFAGSFTEPHTASVPLLSIVWTQCALGQQSALLWQTSESAGVRAEHPAVLGRGPPRVGFVLPLPRIPRWGGRPFSDKAVPF